MLTFKHYPLYMSDYCRWKITILLNSGCLYFCTIFSFCTEMHSSDYKQAAYWFKGSWNSLMDFENALKSSNFNSFQNLIFKHRKENILNLSKKPPILAFLILILFLPYLFNFSSKGEEKQICDTIKEKESHVSNI